MDKERNKVKKAMLFLITSPRYICILYFLFNYMRLECLTLNAQLSFDYTGI